MSDQQIFSTNLTVCQKKVQQYEVEQGIDRNLALQSCLVLGEECGELYKKIHQCESTLINDSEFMTPNMQHEIGKELVDIFICLCSIANKYDICLETQFQDQIS